MRRLLLAIPRIVAVMGPDWSTFVSDVSLTAGCFEVDAVAVIPGAGLHHRVTEIIVTVAPRAYEQSSSTGLDSYLSPV